MGRAAAIAYAREGADVAINYFPSEVEDAQEVIVLVKAEGRIGLGIPGDLRDETFCEELVKRAIEGLGGLDIVINNAARQQTRKSILDVSSEDFDATMKTNIYAPFWIIKAALPRQARRGHHRYIFRAGVRPVPRALRLCANESCNYQLRKIAGQTARSSRLRVNAVAPGPIWTPLQVSGGATMEKLEQFDSQTPLGRAGQPAELASIYFNLPRSTPASPPDRSMALQAAPANREWCLHPLRRGTFLERLGSPRVPASWQRYAAATAASNFADATLPLIPTMSCIAIINTKIAVERLPVFPLTERTLARGAMGRSWSRTSRMLTSLDLTPLAVADFLDDLRLSFVDRSQFCSGLASRFQKFVKFRVDRERVPPVRPLDEQRHGPNDQGGNRMPVKCARLRQKPKYAVEDNDNKGRRMAGKASDSRGPLSWRHVRCSHQRSGPIGTVTSSVHDEA